MKSGDKVVCVDATPLPNISPRDSELDEYLFPDGFIEEGAIYCIDQAFPHKKHPGVYRVFLVGKTIIFRGEEVGWHSHRFRKLDELREPAESEASESIKEVEVR